MQQSTKFHNRTNIEFITGIETELFFILCVSINKQLIPSLLINKTNNENYKNPADTAYYIPQMSYRQYIIPAK